MSQYMSQTYSFQIWTSYTYREIDLRMTFALISVTAADKHPSPNTMPSYF